MEFPHLGRNCAFSTCNRLDFLPMKCGACLESFCSDHFAYTNHDCPAPNTRDVQVPECPLCGAPVPGKRGERPDVAVSEHIDNQCQSDPAKERRKKVYINRCAYKGCKTKEMVPITCGECTLNYCLKHRHTADHACEGPLAAKRKRAAEAAMARLQGGQASKLQFQTPVASDAGRTHVATLQDVQGNMSEDEALARALSLSLQSAALGGGDVAVARALARRVGGEQNSRCTVS
ncbi:AN1-type zinc finger protein 2A-like isoform X2 [Leguminivora glycinivorella]|uniref:AN1-type zinc finger protein 2A-like isoform X2 n=1 Tax=Leguminivora glycinivorella TaxID=1035111 RepID=UPI002010665C|nr:AN1-type zinc finger protein 2A-like isoform X2 [Leguminivora glycinivorella]